MNTPPTRNDDGSPRAQHLFNFDLSRDDAPGLEDREPAHVEGRVVLQLKASTEGVRLTAADIARTFGEGGIGPNLFRDVDRLLREWRLLRR